MNKCVIVYHSPLRMDAGRDELDVLDQARYVGKGMRVLGYTVLVRPFPADVDMLEEELKKNRPLFVFNLVETVRGDGRLITLAPLLFEHFEIPCTGCGSDAIYLSSNKLMAKRVLQSADIPMPAFYGPGDHPIPDLLPGNGFIIKSVWEHASFGLDERTLKLSDGRQVRNYFRNSGNGKHQSFAEQYIDGREFNVSIIGGSDGPVVLPLAEIEFMNYPPGKLRVVGYRAKWDEDSFEYRNTRRSFREEKQDDKLYGKIRELSIRCWMAFGLKGYARVDFRVDRDGQPWVLEINSNPCISPDSGFVAACEHAGMSLGDVIERIIYDAME